MLILGQKLPQQSTCAFRAFWAAVGSAELILPHLECMCLIKQYFAVQARCLWELTGVHRLLVLLSCLWAHQHPIKQSRNLFQHSLWCQICFGGCWCWLGCAVGFMCVGTQEFTRQLTCWKRHQRATKKTNWGTAEPRQADIPLLPGRSAHADALFFVASCFLFPLLSPYAVRRPALLAHRPRAASWGCRTEPIAEGMGSRAKPGRAGLPGPAAPRAGRGGGGGPGGAPGGGRGEAGAPGRPPGPLPGCI